MDSRILLYPDVLKLCGIELTGDDEKDLKMVKEKIREMVARITNRKKLSMNLSPIKDDESKKKAIMDEITDLETKCNQKCELSNLYECIFFYIQHRYPEMIHDANYMYNTNDPNMSEQRRRFIEICQEIVAQFENIADVKRYVDKVLPCLGAIDLKKMSLSDVGASAEVLSEYVSEYSMSVVMNSKPQEIVSGQVRDKFIKIYSFGVFKYDTPTMSETTPHELISVVKKNRAGDVEVFTGIMRLRNLKEMAVDADCISKTDKDSPFAITSGEPSDKKDVMRVDVKQEFINLSDELKKFFLNVVASNDILLNARDNNQNFIGDIQKGGKNPYYGGYRLVSDVIGVQELLETLRVANENPICSKSDGTKSTFSKILEEIRVRALNLVAEMTFENKDNGMEIGD